MNKFGAFLIALTIAATIGTIAVGFKVKNLLFGFIVGFLAIIGLVFIGNILRIAKELSNIFKETRSIITIIKKLFISIYNSFDIFIIIGQMVLYLLTVMKTPDIFSSTEIPKHFKTKNTTVIVSFAAQLLMTIFRTIMKKDLFGEITILIGIITAFLIYDIRTDIEKKKVDKYSYE
tara:strand:+ start:1452 stop:1979 length:528 start_codon:yes stop_codon:yes gene_type:complete